MNTWPTDIHYQWSTNAWEHKPTVHSFTAISGFREQSFEDNQQTEVFTVSLIVNDSELLVVQQFIESNPDKYIGPYFDCDVEQTGLLRIVQGTYKATYVCPNVWRVNFTKEIINREHDTGEHLYNLFEQIPPEDLGQMAQIAKETIDNFKL